MQLQDWRWRLRTAFADRQVIPSDNHEDAEAANPKPTG